MGNKASQTPDPEMLKWMDALMAFDPSDTDTVNALTDASSLEEEASATGAVDLDLLENQEDGDESK